MRSAKSFLVVIILIITFSSSMTKGQYFTKEKCLYLFSAVAFPALEGYVEGLQTKEKLSNNAAERLRINRLWHQWKGLEEGSTIATGIAISFDSDLNFWKILSDLFLSGVLYWIIHDEMINRVNGWNFGFGYNSDFDTGQFMHRISSPYIKIPLLGVAFAANALIFSD